MLGQVGVGPGSGRLRDAEPLGELEPGRDRAALRPGARLDLALDDPGRLEVARDTGQVIKIIWHLASLDSPARLAVC